MRGGGQCIQILAIAAYRTGHLITEGKISLKVISNIRRQSPDINWSAGGQRAWMGHGALVTRGGGMMHTNLDHRCVQNGPPRH